MKRAVIVYQSGIANVFRVDCFNLAEYGREARRMIQNDFHSCEMFVHGLAAAGWEIKAAFCNRAGDISKELWNHNYDSAPFNKSMRILPQWLC